MPISAEQLTKAKSLGFSDRQIAHHTGQSEDAVRDSRLALCELTARILTTGLGLLGIKCPERM